MFKTKTDKPVPSLFFMVMNSVLTIRDWIKDPADRIRTLNIRKGQYILDYGCGRGSFTFPCAQKVGKNGMVYAVDIHPRAIAIIWKKRNKIDHYNIRPVLTDGSSDLDIQDSSIDIILCYDVLHMIKNREKLIHTFYRILKPNGMLSIHGMHLKVKDVQNLMNKIDLFLMEKTDEAVKLFFYRKV